MKIKGWKQTAMTPKWQRWRNKTKEQVVHVVLIQDNTWSFFVKDSERAFIIKNALTKEQAREYAISYMKQHPNG